jgi:[acyl-carrier-protein] S-malonyltransferase
MGVPWKGHAAWAVVERVSEASGRDVERLLLDSDADTLKATRNAQIAAFALGLVAYEGARSSGLDAPVIGAMAGHSLGEYTALVAAGSLTVEAGARLVAARADAMQAAADANPGTMAAVLGLEPDLVALACEEVEGAWPANDNAPGQVVVAGTFDGVAAAGAAAKSLGAKRVMALPVGGAFHSPLMAPAQQRLDSSLRSAHFDRAETDVIANVDAASHRDGWPVLLSRQLVSPVRWRQSLVTLAGRGITHFVELGPGSELSGMVKRTVEGSHRANVATPADLDELPKFLAGAG